MLAPDLRSFLPLALALAGLFGAAVQAQDVDSSYRIGPEDRIEVRVAELPELDTEQEVARDGTIGLPVLGRLDATGFTEDELAVKIRAALEGEGVRRATVQVKVLEFRSQPVTIYGAVAGRATLPAGGKATLLEVLTNAGGLTEDHGDVIRVRRTASNGLSDEVEIAVADLVEGRDPRVNIPIRVGDVITVPRARDLTVFFLGEIKEPLQYKSTERMTLLTAIARRGGLPELARDTVTIRRQTANGVQKIEANYQRILDGRTPDIELQDGDILIVKESFF